MQRIAREHVQRVLDEQEMLNMELENKRRRLDTWSKELNKREALTEREKQKLEEEKKKVIYFSCNKTFKYVILPIVSAMLLMSNIYMFK